MKKHFIMQLALLIWGLGNAQCLINNGTLNSTCPGDGYNTQNNCVMGWTASHGTPTVMGTIGGNTWAWMWSYGNTGEGIMTNYSFQAGQTYQISFRVRATTNIANPNSTVLSSSLNARAASGLIPSSSTTMPSTANSQSIWTNTVAAVGNNWQNVTVYYSPTSNYAQLWFYPLMTASSSANGSAQIQMEVDDVYISPALTTSLFFENASGVRKTDFCLGENVYLNGTNSNNETRYYIDIWRRPIGSTAAFQWQAQLGATGWTNGQVGVINLTSVFAAQNYTLQAGFEYQVKLATANNCIGWSEATRIFRINANNVSPAFTFQSFCDTNGTISVTATASDTTPGISQWWALMEANAPGATSDAATIGQVGAILMGNTVTFTGLSRTKNYYIKHGVYGDCMTWREQRTALPQSVSWSNYTTNFSMAIQAAASGSVSVTTTAASNPVFVNHHWSIFEAPNGVTTGNTNVTGNPDQCCGNTVTFNNNLVINHWYYIKHGIWNDCMNWNETRKAFRVVIQGLQANGSPIYALEEATLSNADNLTPKTNATATNQEIAKVFPNPVTAGSTITIAEMDSPAKVQLIDFTGTSYSLTFQQSDATTVEAFTKNNLKPGIYTLKITDKNGTIKTKKIIVK